jgi:hypothetical protein
MKNVEAEVAFSRRAVRICIGLLCVLVFLAWYGWARAQMPDYCLAPLSAKEAPPAELDWRLRCTIQKLEAERVQQADRATQDEVEMARLAALLRAAQAETQKAAAAKPAQNPPPAVLKGR